MKILRISCENINSLKGPIQGLELGVGLLAKHGLFAITGPTGVGKSTLLDVICVALYGRTPRLERKTDNLMSKLTAYCWAEVEFELKGIEYRCRWELHRSRKKVDGAIQSPKMFLAKIQENLEGEIIEDKFSKVPLAIQELTGLDFQRFCRSMLLAQGEFDAFLKGNENEKAELLEKMTGTEIYKDISVRVYEKAKQFEKQWNENLVWESQHINLKTSRASTEIDQDLNELNGLLKDVTREREQCLKDLAQAELKQKTLLKWNELKEQKAQWDSEALCDFRQRWLRWKKAEPACLWLSRLKESELTFKTMRDKIKGHETSLAKLAERQFNENEKKVVLEKQFKETNKKYAKLEAIYPSILKLIERKNGLLEKEMEASKSVTKLKGSESILKDSFEKHLADKARYDRDLEGISKWQEQYGEFEGLSMKLQQKKETCESYFLVEQEVSVLERSKMTLSNKLKESTPIIANKSKRLDELLSEVESLKLKLNEVESELKEEDQLLNSENEFESLLLRTAECEKLHQLTVSLEERKAELKESIQLQTRDETELKTKQEAFIKLEKELHKLKKEGYIYSLSEARESLEENEVCPLCGSKEHATHNLVDFSEVSAKDMHEKEKAVAYFQTDIVKLKEKLRLNEQTNKDIEDKLEADVRLLEESLQKLGIESAVIELSLLKDKKSQLHNKVSKTRELKNKTLKLHQDHQKANEQCRLLQNELNTLRYNEKGDSVELKQVEYQLEVLKNRQAEMTQAILEDMSWLDCEVTSIKSILEKVIDFYDDMKLRKESLTRLTEMKQQVSLAIARAEEQLKESEQKTGMLEGQLQGTKVELSLLEAELHELYESPKTFELDYKNVAAVRSKLESELQLMDKKLHELDFNINHTHLEKVKLEEELPVVQSELKLKEQSLITSYTEQGFENQLALEAATLNEVDLSSLGEWNKEYESRGQLLEIKLSEIKKDYEASPDSDVEALKAVQIELDERVEVLSKKSGSLLREKEEDLNWQKQHSEHLEKRNKLEKDHKEWALLRQLIGSADGSSFRKIAQKVTLKFLLKLANRHLETILERYKLMEASGPELNIILVDQYQAMSERPLETLSGGERFMVSLALALALSDISRRGQSIESLFIDEGFGALDAHALDRVLEALDKIRQMGRSIGVISHVEALKERISAQIKIEPLRNGISQVSIVEGH